MYRFNPMKVPRKESEHNLTVVGAEREKVKQATKLFSNICSTRAVSLGFLAMFSIVETD